MRRADLSPRVPRGRSAASHGSHGADAALVQQVLRDCPVHVAPQLALEAVRLLQVDPDNLRGLRAACVRFLLDRQAPRLAATRMRIAFRRKYRTAEETAAEQARGVEARLAPLLAEVLEPPEGNPFRGELAGGDIKDRVYGTVVAAAVLRSGLGSPADPAVIKEANAAMQSVYPARELPQLLRLPAAERRAQLLEVCRIAAGVRIFNWNCSKAGHGLLDLPSLVQEAAEVTRGLLQEAVQRVEARLWPATAALEAVYLGPQPATLPEPDTDLLKETVVYLRQQQVLLRRLLEDVEHAAAEARRLDGVLQAGLAEVHSVVQAKATVPTNQVYPQFMSLACTWEALETQAVVVSKATNLHRRLEAYSQDVRTLDATVIDGILEGRAAPTDAERVSTVSLKATEEKDLVSAMRRRLARDLETGAAVATELEGFCPWFLAVSGGGLLPGRPALGLCEAAAGAAGPDKTPLYALSSLHAAQLFTADPDRWIQDALNEVRRRPAMVGLLGLWDALVPKRNSFQWVPPARLARETLRTSDAEVQTEQPERLRRCKQQASWSRTLSATTQTEVSTYRRSGQVQTFPARDAAVQCPRTVGCSAGWTPALPSGKSYILDMSTLSVPSVNSEDDPIPATSFLELSSARASPVSQRSQSSCGDQS